MRNDRFPRLGSLLLLLYLPNLVFAVVVWVITPIFVRMLDAEASVIAEHVSRSEADGVWRLAEHAEAPWLWASGVAAVFAVAGALIWRWANRVLHQRLQRATQFLEDLSTGQYPESLSPTNDDDLGRLEQGLSVFAERMRKRDIALRYETQEHELEAQVQRGLAMAETEVEVLNLAQRTFDIVSPDVPTELLMADQNGARLLSVLHSAGEPGCPVRSPQECLAARRGHTMVFPDASALDACPKLRNRDTKVGGALCVPVSVLGQPVGVLHAISTVERPFAHDTQPAYQSLARHLGSRLGMIRALQNSQLRAETDALTGLYNRRSFSERAPAIFERGPAAVVMADLDHFKKLNDTFGHDAGDRALCRFSKLLQQTLRPTDLVARYGGEEFVMVFAESDAQAAGQALERLREAIHKSNQQASGPPITASFGVALRPLHGLDIDELVRSADGALYVAKENGRDRFEIAGSKIVAVDEAA